ncbi:MAG: ABC transporter permease subunit [Agathobacter sp.]|nr:ABC transporter permease subunit [Agathobacter sp.]
MKSLLAFMKKEWMEQLRSGRLLILAIVFVLLGIMNPAVAKLTPWLFEIMADSLEESGMVVTTVTVDAMSSWVQFFKNLPMGLIIFILLESGIFTKEYQSGTLVLALTKGLDRYKVVFSKASVLLVLWTFFYWICYGITYGYNEYFWDNGVAHNLTFSAICWWLFGLWAIMLMVLFSAIANSNTGVLAGTGAVILAGYLLGLLPKIKKYSPSLLMDGNSLIYGVEKSQTYTIAIIVTVILSVMCLAISIPILNKKKI